MHRRHEEAADRPARQLRRPGHVRRRDLGGDRGCRCAASLRGSTRRAPTPRPRPPRPTATCRPIVTPSRSPPLAARFEQRGRVAVEVERRARVASAGSTRGAAGSPRPPGSRARPAPCARRARCRGSRATSGSGGSTSRSRAAARRRGVANQPSPSCWRRQASSSVDHQVGLLGLEVGGRIVEGEVAVLADAHEGDVDGAAREERAHARGLRRRVGGVALDEVEGARVDALDDPLPQVAAEARGMRVGQPDVLVEVEEHRPATSRCPASRSSASRNSNCEAPVAAMTCARALRARARRAARRPPAPPPRVAISAFVSKTRISIAHAPPERAAPRAPDQELQPLLGHQPVVGLRHVDAVEADEARRGRERRRGARLTSTTVMPLARAAAASFPSCVRVAAVGVVHVVEASARARPPRRSPAPSVRKFARSSSVRLITTSRTCVGLPGRGRPRRSACTARVEVSPPPWNCRNSTFGFSRANIAVTMGTKARGRRPVEVHREGVADRPRRAAAGRRSHPRDERGHVRLLEQLAGEHLRRRGCARFFSPQFQILRPAICHSAARQADGRGAALALELAAHREEVGVAARAGRAARRRRAGRGRCRSGTAPAGGRRRAPPRGWSGTRFAIARTSARGAPWRVRRQGSSVKTLTGSVVRQARARDCRSGSRSAFGIEARRAGPPPRPCTAAGPPARSAAWCASSASSAASRRGVPSASRPDRPCPSLRARPTWKACVPAMFASTRLGRAGRAGSPRRSGAARSSAARRGSPAAGPCQTLPPKVVT